ncbi:MAG: PAS domain S-box protein, partial [Bacteroidales bacterium]|nr:PAS domain S-box protein [Bacteroidales bacterium]
MEQKDQRIDQIIEVIQKIAAGNYTSRINISDAKDDVDGICTGINMLSEEVERLIVKLNEENERLQETIEKLQSTTSQLSKSEELFSKIFHTSPDSMIISRLHDGTFIDVNDGFCQATGYTRDEVIGKKVFELGLWIDKKGRDNLIACLKKDGIVTNLSIRFKRKDKQIRDTLLSAIVIVLNDVPHMLTITRDISVLKATEREITEAKERYENLVATAPDGIVVLNITGKITMVNQAFVGMAGYAEEEILGMHFTKFQGFRKRDIPRFVKAFASILQGKAPKPMELRWENKDGHIMISEMHTSVLKKENKIIGGLAIVRDITDRVRDREALEASETQYRTSMDALEEIIHVVNNDLEIVLANQAMIKGLKVLGMPSETIGKKYYEVYPFLEKSVKDEYKEVFKSGKSIRKEEEYKLNNQTLFTDTKLIPIFKDKKVDRILTVVQDITERKEAELVREIMNKISTAVNLTKDLNELSQVIRIELGRIFDTTNFFIALYNKEDDTLSLPLFVDEKDSFSAFPAGKSLTGYVIRNDLPLLMKDKDIRNLVKKGEIDDVGTPSRIWLGVPLKIKEEIIGALVVQSYEDENAYTAQDLEMLKFVSNQIGLSIETKRAVDNVQVEKAYFEQLFESSPEIVVLTDIDGKLLRVNNEFEILFKYESQEVIGKHIDDLIIPPEFMEEAKSISKRVAAGEKIWVETIRHDKFGNRFYVNLLGTPVQIEGEQVGVYGIYRDITPQKKSQLALAESEEKLRNILYSSPDPITVVDLRGNITECNPAAVEILGFSSAEEIIGTNALQLAAPGERSRGISALKHVLRKGFIKNEEFELYLRNNEKINVELSASIIKDANDKPIG